MEKAENRNQFVDIMRGIAMLLVVLGHTMTGCTVDSQKSFIFNIIWSLQMPLFMRKQKHLTMRSPTSLLPVPTSVHTLSWDAVVWYCKMPVSRTVRPLATVFC